MALSSVQQGVISQSETAKLGMMGTNGKLEFSNPLSDDERRDAEIHPRGWFGSPLALQIKSSMVLHPHRGGRISELLNVHWSVAADRLINDPRFWYFFAYLDRKTMAFRDPVFLVDSATVHRLASPKLRGGIWYFDFQASMAPDSRDKWVPYRLRIVDVGNRMLEIIDDFKQLSLAETGPLQVGGLGGVVLVHRTR